MGPVKSGSKHWLALLSEVIYIILRNRATKCGSIKRLELLTGKLLTEVCIYCMWSMQYMCIPISLVFVLETVAKNFLVIGSFRGGRQTISKLLCLRTTAIHFGPSQYHAA